MLFSVVPAFQEPLPGWIDNRQGPAGVTLAGGMGLLRVLNMPTTRNAPLVPIDFCANMTLAAAWYNTTTCRER